MRPTIDATPLAHSLPLVQPALIDPSAAPASSASAASSATLSPTMPSVLFVDQSGQLGGAEFALLQLAGSCIARSEVVLLSDGPFRARLETLGARVQVLNDARVSGIVRQASGLNCLRVVPGILRQVRAIAARARKFDVLFLNTQKALVLGALGKPLHRKPVIWYQHDILTREHFGRVQLSIIKWLVRLAVDHVVANSQASKRSLIALTGIAADSVPVIYNGVDADAFKRIDDSDIATLRRRLGLPEHAWLAGLFGRLAPWKGQHIALEAMARLPGVHLVLVGAPLFGEDAYAQRLHEQAEALGVADRVHFAGFQDDVPVWMKAMDVILHTSTEPEPFGRVIVEGMAAARPVIAAAAGGVTEIVRHRRNGWLVKPGDVAALADAIGTLRDDPVMAQRLADQALADAQTEFSVDQYLQRMMQAIGRAAR
ncbi:glycosyltransferase family 4 protein [Paraburkholderia madseniana]|uniref:Glycosyltransferase family 4 protein n=1 Tax=Paraburkholderia madseniana TaxID=2599607 RepID=A0AAP5BAV5_9BURK|nr:MULTISPECIES: glycosyltransferase family 4 protein [Paraburkholderia]MCX4146325.1 glycosyltransferase family 4 protein [Paraburkholderia madseniana]MDN7149271.1 glycosyltransferase family 4 protein [Paraburkholderia sp. WS6]MDQ6408151.1 glycosyltransferase family 4 protein [Paraburkholderia madseniana]